MLANIRIAACLAGATIAAVLANAPAAAASRTDQQSVAVSYQDLDLKSDRGVARLQQRVKSALDQVCGRLDSRDLTTRAQINVCRAAAMTQAQGRIEVAVAGARGDTRLADLSAPSIKVDAH